MPSYKKEVSEWTTEKVPVFCDRCNGSGWVPNFMDVRNQSPCPKCGGRKILGYKEVRKEIGGTTVKRTEF